MGGDSQTPQHTDVVSASPPCFGNPERVPACQTCGVRDGCWEEHYKRHPHVFLLPNDRPVPMDRVGARKAARE